MRVIMDFYKKLMIVTGVVFTSLLTVPVSVLAVNNAMNHSSSNFVLDLTYAFDKKTIYWPTEKGFDLKALFYGETPEGYFYSAYRFCAPEHGGTHLDAPRHFSKNGLTVDEIPPEQLVGVAVVVAVNEQAQKNRDYAITRDDIIAFEKKNRILTSNDIVLFYTGWGRYWGDKKAYLGSDIFRDVKNLHFPGISKAAAEYLVMRQVKGVGIDTASLDPGVSQNFWAHRILLGHNIYGIENLANLGALPPVGAQLIVGPMKIAYGSGGPTRVLAIKNSFLNKQ